MSDWTFAAATFVLGCGLVLYIGRRFLASQSHYPLPPGPPGLPFVGNVIGINTSAPWVTYADWAKTYGKLATTHSISPHILKSTPYRRHSSFQADGKGYYHNQF